MSFDLRNEKMQPASLFGKAVLFTPQYIDAQDVPPGWDCYDLRGTRQRPDEPAFLEDESYLYRLGSVLSPVPLKKLFTTSKRVSGQFQSLGDPITLREFCRDWSLFTQAVAPIFPVAFARFCVEKVCQSRDCLHFFFLKQSKSPRKSRHSTCVNRL